MQRATDFEFRNRWWLFGAIFGVSFVPVVLDHVPVGVRLAELVARMAHGLVASALHWVYGVSAAIMVAAALIRTWGSAYLGRDVVHDSAVRGEALRADGPYRHVRNPLYLGNILMTFAMVLFAPVIGCPLMLIAVPLFCYRLIGREEQVLEAEQGERYRAFMRAVPRLWPSLMPRIPAGGGAPDWINGLSAEAFFWSFALGVIAFACTLNIFWFYAGLVASPLLSWLAGAVLRKREPAPGA